MHVVRVVKVTWKCGMEVERAHFVSHVMTCMCGECGTEVERAHFVSRVMTSVVCGGECGTVIERAHFVSRV